MKPQKEAWLNGEPTIDDVLSDPIVQSLVRSDGLTYEDVHAAVALARLDYRLSTLFTTLPPKQDSTHDAGWQFPVDGQGMRKLGGRNI